MRKWLIAAAAAAVFMAPGAVMAQQPIIIKFSHVVSPDDQVAIDVFDFCDCFN